MASFALGSAALKLESKAVISVTRQACVALVADGQQGHKLTALALPSARRSAASRVQPASSIAGAVAHSSVPLPAGARGCAVHVLLTSSSQAAVAAVVAQDGAVHYAELHSAAQPSPEQLLGTQLRQASPPAGDAPATKAIRGSCAWHSRLWTLHQAAAGGAATVHEYHATSSGSSATVHLRHVAAHAVPAPPSPSSPPPLAMSLHASPSSLLVSWSSGTFTVLRPGAATPPQHLSPPPHFLPSSSNTQPHASPSAAGGKRKASSAAPASGADGGRPLALAACPLDDTQLLVVSPSGTALSYALLDVQYGCTLASGALTAADVPQLASPLPAGTPPPPLQLLSAPAAPGRVLLQLGQLGVLALTVDAPPASLLSLVGKGQAVAATTGAATAAQQPAAPTAAVDVAALLQLLSVHAQPAGTTAAAAAACAEVSLQPLPPAAVQSLQPREGGGGSGGSAAAVQRLASALRKALDEGKPAPPGVLREAAGLLSSPAPQQQQQPAWVTQAHLAPLVARAMAQAGEWAGLQQVLESAPAPLSGCGQVLPAAARAAQYHLLPLLSTRLEDVSPEHTVEALAALLSPGGGAAGGEAGAGAGTGTGSKSSAAELKQLALARRKEYLHHLR